MRRWIIVIAVIAGLAGGGAYYLKRAGGGDGANAAAPGPGGAPGGRGFGPGGFGGPRLPMTVEVAAVKRADMAQRITVVGNLVGAATVEATPKVSGRLEAILVRLGDRVSRGQTLAKIEDSELLEQIKQAQASYEVATATIRQREADLRLAKINLDRSQNLYERQLIPKQTLDDTDARYQASVAQLDLARAQDSQAMSRLEELKINLANTQITSPVNGFIGKRTLDPGAWVTPNSTLLSVVDIAVVRIIANVVERDLRRISQGLKAQVEVDAFPGESFNGIVAHVAPVLDPATRTAQIEIEIPNQQFRLKPGMYARVDFKVDQRDNTLVVPANAVVDLEGSRGVFQPDKGAQGDVVRFKKIEIGLSDNDFVEVASGLDEGDRVVTTGAGALREGDRIVLLGQSGAERGNAEGAARGRRSGPNGAGSDGRRGPPQTQS
jgi:RND family efflux transporter MFP subunit